MKLNTVCLPSSGHHRHHPPWQSTLEGLDGGQCQEQNGVESVIGLTVPKNNLFYIVDFSNTLNAELKYFILSKIFIQLIFFV